MHWTCWYSQPTCWYFTKPLNEDQFCKIRRELGMIDVNDVWIFMFVKSFCMICLYNEWNCTFVEHFLAFSGAFMHFWVKRFESLFKRFESLSPEMSSVMKKCLSDSNPSLSDSNPFSSSLNNFRRFESLFQGFESIFQ